MVPFDRTGMENPERFRRGALLYGICVEKDERIFGISSKNERSVNLVLAFRMKGGYAEFIPRVRRLQQNENVFNPRILWMFYLMQMTTG